jgi:hypothetical protein
VPRAVKWQLRCPWSDWGLGNKKSVDAEGTLCARTMELVLANQGKDAQTLSIAAQLLQPHGDNA